MTQHPRVKRGEILVLATRRLIGNGIRDELIGLNHPSQSFFTEDCLTKPSAKEGFCLLRLLVNLDDRVALRAWLGIDSQNYRSATYHRVRTAARNANSDVGNFLKNVAAGTMPQVKNSAGLMARFQDMNTRLGSMSALSGTALVDQLWPVGDPGCADIRGFALALAPNSSSRRVVGSLDRSHHPT